MKPDKINILGQEVALDTNYLNLFFSGEVEKAELESLLQLKRLKHLNTSCSDLVDTHLEIIGQIETLQLLDLDSTEITDHGLRYLNPLKQLRELRLKDNPQLTDKSIESLSKIESLKLIHLGSTSITIEGLRTLISKIELESIILGFDFEDLVDDLLIITEKYPKLEITLKGTGVISNGELNE